MKRPFILLSLALMAGILMGSTVSIPDLPLQLSLVFALLFTMAAFRKKFQILAAILLTVSLCIAGVLDINASLRMEPEEIPPVMEEVVLDGMICENPEVSPERTELVVSPIRIIGDETIHPVRSRLLLSVNDHYYPFQYGNYIHAKTRLRKPHNFNNPGGFDHEKFLRCRGITVQGFVNDPSDIAIIRENRGNPFREYLETYRSSLRNLVRTHAPSPEGAIIQAMILGEQKEIPQDIREMFNRTGTSHIIAISGFNVGIIIFFSVLVIRVMMKPSEYLLLRFNAVKVSSILSLIPIVAFTLIAGMGISVIRATIMAIAFMAALLWDKEADLYNILGLAAFAILAVSPTSLFDISFQLSFAAVASILFLTPAFTSLLPHRIQKSGKLCRGIILFLAATTAATLGTLPIIATYFNRISTVVLPANIIVVPILGIIATPFCLAIIFFAPLSTTLAVIFIKISSFLVTISLGLVGFFADLPGSSITTITPTAMEIIAYYLTIIVLAALIDWWKKPAPERRMAPWLVVTLCALMLVLAAEGVWLLQRGNEEKFLKITAIDVAQGSATLVRFPGGKSMLIDGGGFPRGDFDMGKYVLAPFLLHERIRRLDFVVMTHPHPDHLNGLIYILKNFPVGEIWSTAQTMDTAEYETFMRLAAEHNTPHRVIASNPEETRIGPATVLIMAGNAAVPSNRFAMINDTSVVMKITYGKTSILLPGDIAEKAETSLIRSGVNVKSDVLFVPHHGGFQSSSPPFLDHVQPRVAIISCGLDNIYHDPHRDVLARYAARRVKIFRTDRDGAITIRCDGERIFTNIFKKSVRDEYDPDV